MNLTNFLAGAVMTATFVRGENTCSHTSYQAISRFDPSRGVVSAIHPVFNSSVISRTPDQLRVGLQTKKWVVSTDIAVNRGIEGEFHGRKFSNLNLSYKFGNDSNLSKKESLNIKEFTKAYLADESNLLDSQGLADSMSQKSIFTEGNINFKQTLAERYKTLYSSSFKEIHILALYQVNSVFPYMEGIAVVSAFACVITLPPQPVTSFVAFYQNSYSFAKNDKRRLVLRPYYFLPLSSSKIADRACCNNHTLFQEYQNIYFARSLINNIFKRILGTSLFFIVSPLVFPIIQGGLSALLTPLLVHPPSIGFIILFGGYPLFFLVFTPFLSWVEKSIEKIHSITVFNKLTLESEIKPAAKKSKHIYRNYEELALCSTI